MDVKIFSVGATHPVVTIVRKEWEEVGKELYCDKPNCDECRIIDKVTQGGGSSGYHDEKHPWQAKVTHVLIINTPIPQKRYRIWLVELFRQGASIYQYKIETYQEHWSLDMGRWCKG